MIPLTRRSTEEAYAVRSAGGKAAQGIVARNKNNVQNSPVLYSCINSYADSDKTAKND